MRATVVGLAWLATAGCGAPGAAQSQREPFRTEPPALLGAPRASLTGTVFVARAPVLDQATKQPAGYQVLPDAGGQVAAWPVACREPCAERSDAPVIGGRYRLLDLPLGTPLVVAATAPGATPRRIVTTLRADAILDFKADPERATGAYLVDAPEAVAVEPVPEQDLVSAGVSRFRVRFSEPIDPASLAADALTLTSPDLPGLRLAGDTAFFGRAATVSADAPDAAVLALAGPLPALARAGGLRLHLSVGKGRIREA
ncbi:MAG: hypothetical protein FJZ01_25015, partial [Candidatus Sericytochromatia bacterium]|nr:hypothetical protein [Candidatus Tanganyikabacteria bacterium]